MALVSPHCEQPKDRDSVDPLLARGPKLIETPVNIISTASCIVLDLNLASYSVSTHN